MPFQPGVSGNPQGRPRKAAKTPKQAPAPDPAADPDPRSIAERLAVKLMAIVADPASDVGSVIRAARLLASQDMKPGVRGVMERSNREAHQARMVPLIANARVTIASEFPGVADEEVEDFIGHYSVQMLENDDYNAGYQFYEMARDWGWITEEDLEAARATESADRDARIKAGRPAPEPPVPGGS